MKALEISSRAAPPLGEIRALTDGEVLLYPTARDRTDWPRYLDALVSAIAHGVSVRWVVP